MYRINLYPDYQQKKLMARQRTMVMGVLMILVGLEIMLVGVLMVSDHLLRERATQLRDEMPVLEARLQSLTHPRPELELATELLSHRGNRLDWTPKLAAIADSCSPELVFSEVEGRSRSQHEPPHLRIKGEVRHHANSLAAVTEFVRRLRDDERVGSEFPDVALGDIRDSDTGEFEVSCEQTEDKP